MRKTRASELLASHFVDAVVLAEDEAAGERALVGVEAGGNGALGTAARAVE